MIDIFCVNDSANLQLNNHTAAMLSEALETLRCVARCTKLCNLSNCFVA